MNCHNNNFSYNHYASDCWHKLPPPPNHKLQGNRERGQSEGDPSSVVAFPRKHDSSTAHNSTIAWTYKGDIPHDQEELVWLAISNFTSLTNSSRTKLRVTATFVNTFGEATHTDEFEFGKSSDSSTVLLYS